LLLHIQPLWRTCQAHGPTLKVMLPYSLCIFPLFVSSNEHQEWVVTGRPRIHLKLMN
jgi:hypothetical protein